MRFTETPIAGAYVIEIEPVADERGFFARTWCRDELRDHGLNPELAQCSVSGNRSRGTLRGMHYQEEPYGECKLVQCTAGAVYDVIADLRRESHSFRTWFAVELSARDHRALYVPKGVAHGFQTLVDDTEVFYQISESYRPEYTRGFRWDDPAFSIRWPAPPTGISSRDRSYPDFHL